MDETSTRVRVDRRGRIEVWTLDGPDRANALSRATVRELGRLARSAAREPEVAAVVIAGEGAKVFCAGADLKERQGMVEEEVRDFLSLYRASFGAIDALPKPVVAALNGSAYGGGLELALAADFRVIAAGAQIGLTETSLAIIPGAGGTQRLTRIVGPAKAKELILFARRISAEEALSLGLVERLVPAGSDVTAAAVSFVEPLVDGAPIAIAAALDAIDAATELSLEEGLTHERRCYERTLASADRLEALAAFREKRRPVYRGE